MFTIKVSRSSEVVSLAERVNYLAAELRYYVKALDKESQAHSATPGNSHRCKA
jgi:hypothetical protein